VWCDPEVETELSVTNAGHDRYDRTATARAILIGATGTIAETSFEIAPYATRVVDVRDLFPGADTALAPSGHGLVIIESTSDLANVAFTRHRTSGAVAVEHFMGWETFHNGDRVKIAGA
jgi:hypothetical protein